MTIPNRNKQRSINKQMVYRLVGCWAALSFFSSLFLLHTAHKQETSDFKSTINAIENLSLNKSINSNSVKSLLKEKMQDRERELSVAVLEIELFKIIFLGTLVLFILHCLVTVDLRAIVSYLQRFDFDTEMKRQEFPLSKKRKRIDELSEMADALASMLATVQRTHKKAKAKQKKQESIIEERTRSINAILTSLKQGVLMIDESGKVLPEYSEYTKSILGIHRIDREDSVDLIFTNVIAEDVKSQVRSVILSSIGAPKEVFEVNKHLLQTNIIRSINGQVKSLEITWMPITNRNGLTEKILVILEDSNRG